MGDLIFNGGGPKKVSVHHSLTSGKASMVCGSGTSSQCMTTAIFPPSYRTLFRFTVRNITVNNAQSAVFMNWNWGNTPTPFYKIRGSNSYLGWTFQSVIINNCHVGFDLNSGGTRGQMQAWFNT